ncbi:MAG: YmdB family metallophosphoesterase [Pseudonocardiaceae bacterium]
MIIDLHGESAWEKASFATAVDGQVAAVLGTHTHDPRCVRTYLPAAPDT